MHFTNPQSPKNMNINCICKILKNKKDKMILQFKFQMNCRMLPTWPTCHVSNVMASQSWGGGNWLFRVSESHLLIFCNSLMFCLIFLILNLFIKYVLIKDNNIWYHFNIEVFLLGFYLNLFLSLSLIFSLS